jgi:hypothetical protein
MRRTFQLPEEDEECLTNGGFKWETAIEAAVKWLIIQDYPLPEGYTQRAANLALRISPSYPDDQIDMVYFHPGLSLMSGKTINALTPHAIDGRPYQQWSRHRTSANPWRPGVDNICTHLLQVDTWLKRELN